MDPKRWKQVEDILQSALDRVPEERDAFHAITMDFGTGGLAIHGYILRDGTWSKVASASVGSVRQ